jgi:hypothetical protein
MQLDPSPPMACCTSAAFSFVASERIVRDPGGGRMPGCGAQRYDNSTQ